MEAQRARRLSNAVTILAVVAAAATSILFLVWPAYPGGLTLLDVNGARVVLPLLVPVVVACVPLMMSSSLRRRTSGIAGALMTVLCFIGSFSIGFAYVPIAILLVIGAGIPVTDATLLDARSLSDRG